MGTQKELASIEATLTKELELISRLLANEILSATDAGKARKNAIDHAIDKRTDAYIRREALSPAADEVKEFGRDIPWPPFPRRQVVCPRAPATEESADQMPKLGSVWLHPGDPRQYRVVRIEPSAEGGHEIICKSWDGSILRTPSGIWPGQLIPKPAATKKDSDEPRSPESHYGYPEIGSRWMQRSGYDPSKGPYNGYTVRAITNTEHIHPDHPSQVVYQGDNGKMWSLDLATWPGSLVPEPSITFGDEGMTNWDVEEPAWRTGQKTEVKPSVIKWPTPEELRSRDLPAKPTEDPGRFSSSRPRRSRDVPASPPAPPNRSFTIFGRETRASKIRRAIWLGYTQGSAGVPIDYLDNGRGLS